MTVLDATAGPGFYNDSVVRGNSYLRQYQCKLSNGNSVDLTGFVVRWRGVYGDAVIMKSTDSDTLSMVTPANGTIGLALTPAETRLVPDNDNMRYELEIIAPDQSQRTILWGNLVGKGGVSSD